MLLPMKIGEKRRIKTLRDFIEKDYKKGITVIFDKQDIPYKSTIKTIDISDYEINFKGEGKPSEVYLVTKFSIINSNVTIKNLSIDISDTDLNEAIYIENSMVELSNVLIKGNLKGNPFKIKGSRSTVVLNNVTVENDDSSYFGVTIKENSKVYMNNSKINMLLLENGYLNIRDSLITNSIQAKEESKIEKSNLYLGINRYKEDVYLKDSEININSIIIIEGRNYIDLDKSLLKFNEYYCDEYDYLKVKKDDLSKIYGSNFELIEEDISQNANTNDLETQINTDNLSSLPESEDLHKVKMKTSNHNESSDVKSIEKINNLVGLESLKKSIREFINIAKIHKIKLEKGISTNMPVLHSLFLGNPGTGKTTVARLMAKVLFEEGVIRDNNFIEVSRKDLVGQHIGHTAPKTQEYLEKATDGILFIDEAYTLVNGSNNDFGKEAMDTILKYMEDYRDRVMIIFAGYTNEMHDFINSNPGLKSRIPNIFYFEDYNVEELTHIGKNDLLDKQYQFEVNEYIKFIRNNYRSNYDCSNAKWIRNLNEKLINNQIQRISKNNIINENDLLVLDKVDYKFSDTKTFEDLESLLLKLDNLIGLSEVKKQVYRIVNEVKFNSKLEEQGKDFNKSNYHMIFAGAPGTGKTTVARLLSKIFKSLGLLQKGHLIETDKSNLIGQYIGHTEKNTLSIVEKSLGGILFIDEAYQLNNENSNNDFGKIAIETLITQLENHRDKFITIFAGYDEDMKRFLRTNEGLKSRIPYIIHFDNYTPEEIAEIVIKNLSENWTFNKKLLRDIIVKKYKSLPIEEQSNGRWARNFEEKLLLLHKTHAIENIDAIDDITCINDKTITLMSDYSNNF